MALSFSASWARMRSTNAHSSAKNQNRLSSSSLPSGPTTSSPQHRNSIEASESRQKVAEAHIEDRQRVCVFDGHQFLVACYVASLLGFQKAP